MKFKGLFLVAVGFFAFGEAIAADANFYAGKKISLVVGSTTGGAIDGYARLLARHIGRHIPGNPAIVVQNMPGASGLVAVQSLDTVAPRDGTTFATFASGQIVQAITSSEKVKVKFSEFAWLGSVTEEARVCYMWGTTGVKTWEELLKRDQVVMGDTGGGSASVVNQRILHKIFGVKIKQILGYPGGAEKRLAIERGELDGDCGPWPINPASWLRDNKINLVLRFSHHVLAGMPESLTYVGDLVKEDPFKKGVIELLAASARVGRPFIMSRSVPADRVQIMRSAFDATMNDPQFIADAEKLAMIVSPFAGAEIEGYLKSLDAAPASVVEAAREILGE